MSFFQRLSDSIFKLRTWFGYVNHDGRRYSTTRFVMYNSIENFLKDYPVGKKILLISEHNEHSIRNMLPSNSDFLTTSFPDVSVTNLSKFKNSSFDVVVTDQVLEHVPDPFKAVEEIHRVLKKNGLAINTSCAFNPIHDSVDYFRFTKSGFKELHRKFSKILLLDAWGNRDAISRFVRTGYISFNVRSNPWEKKLISKNDPIWPWSVWCIARK